MPDGAGHGEPIAATPSFPGPSRKRPPPSPVKHKRASNPQLRHDIRRTWLKALGIMGLAALVVGAVIVVAQWHHRQARRELNRLVADAQVRGGTQEVVRALEEYVTTHPDNPVTHRAANRLEQARIELDDEAFDQALKADKGNTRDLDAAEATLRSYLDAHPDGRHRSECGGRLAAVQRRKDDHAYEQSAANAKAAGSDLQAKQQAWQAYLDNYPQGRHSVQVQAELGRIPDEAESNALEQCLLQVQTMVEQDRLGEALTCIDRAMDAIEAPARRQTLMAKIDGILDRFEAIDATACLAEIPEGRSARAQLQQACEFYVLCYPTGKHHAAVEERLDRLAALQRDSEWQAFRRSLEKYADEPLQALYALDDYQSRGDDLPEDFHSQRVRFHVQLLISRIEASLAKMQLITTAKSGTILGIAKELGTGMYSIQPRALDGTMARSVMLKSDQVVRMEEPSLLIALRRLEGTVQRMQSDEAWSTSVLLTEVRHLRELAEPDTYECERRACEVCIAALDPADQEVAEALADAGYVRHRGVFQPASAVDSTPLLAPPQAQQPHVSSSADILRYYKKTLAGSEHVGELLALLPEEIKYMDYAVLGQEISVPVKWSLTQAGVNTRLLSGDDEAFHGEIQFDYQAQAKRQGSAGIPSSVLDRVDAKIESINAQQRIGVIYEVRRKDVAVTGIGLTFGQQGDAVVVVEVVPGGPAESVGVKAGDVLHYVGSRVVPGAADPAHVEAMLANAPTEGVELMLGRSDRRFRVRLPQRQYSVEQYQVRKRLQIGPLVNDEHGSVNVDWTVIAPPPG
jgi:hypothetical protein